MSNQEAGMCSKESKEDPFMYKSYYYWSKDEVK